MTMNKLDDLVGRLELITNRIEETVQQSEWLSVSRAARYVGVSRRTLISWIKKYNIPHSQVPSGTILIKLSFLYDWLRSYEIVKNEIKIRDENFSKNEEKIVEEILEDLL